MKNEARQALRRAKKEGDESNLPLLAGKFLLLLREHSNLKRQADNQQTVSEVKRVREEGSKHFWKFPKDLLHRNTASSVSPSFSPSVAHSHFMSSAQQSLTLTPLLCGCHLLLLHSCVGATSSYSTPVWMPPPLTPLLCGCHLLLLHSCVGATSSYSTPVWVPPPLTPLLCGCHLLLLHCCVGATSSYSTPVWMPPPLTPLLCGCHLLLLHSCVGATSSYSTPVWVPPPLTPLLCGCHLLLLHSCVGATSSYSTPVWVPPPLTPLLCGCHLLLLHSCVDATSSYSKAANVIPQPISIEELVGAIKRSRSTSAPSPLDQIPYTVLKNCPSLIPPLLDHFNTILSERSIPSNWKVAVFKLIGKSAALTDPYSPNNFRLIVLTPAISKLSSGILKDRWLQYMLDNGYLDPIVQKAFLPSVSGVTEHQCKLAAIISGARQDKRSRAVAWLDIANAYGSIDHSPIQFSLNPYHAPSDFSKLIQLRYTDLVATISIPNGISPLITLKIGVLQGDPLSVVLFFTVMATLSAVKIPNSQSLVNHLLYADDTHITANSPAACQELLNMVQQWLEWANMTEKPSKSTVLCIKASTGSLVRCTHRASHSGCIYTVAFLR